MCIKIKIFYVILLSTPCSSNELLNKGYTVYYRIPHSLDFETIRESYLHYMIFYVI